MQATQQHWQACHCVMSILYYISLSIMVCVVMMGDVCASLMNGLPVSLTRHIPWLWFWKAVILPQPCLSSLFTSHGGNQSGFIFSVILNDACHRERHGKTKPFRRAVLFQRELDQNSTMWYCVMCSSLFRIQCNNRALESIHLPHMLLRECTGWLVLFPLHSSPHVTVWSGFSESCSELNCGRLEDECFVCFFLKRGT